MTRPRTDSSTPSCTAALAALVNSSWAAPVGTSSSATSR